MVPPRPSPPTIETALADAGANVDDVAVIGVGVPGRVDPVTGNVTIAVNLGWTDLALRDALEARLGRPCVIENDARAAAVGLHYRRVLGSSRGHRLSRGRHRDRGRASSSTAGSTVARAASPARSATPSPTTPARSAPAASAAVSRRSSRGRRSPAGPSRRSPPIPAGRGRARSPRTSSPRSTSTRPRPPATGSATDLVEDVGRQLAWAIHLLVMAYDVDRVVLGGGVSHAGETFMAPIQRELDRLRAASPIAGELLPEASSRPCRSAADAGVLRRGRDRTTGAPARRPGGRQTAPGHRRATHRRGRRCVTPDRYRRPSDAARMSVPAPRSRGERGGAMQNTRALTLGIAAILAVAACAAPAASTAPSAAPPRAASHRRPAQRRVDRAERPERRAHRGPRGRVHGHDGRRLRPVDRCRRPVLRRQPEGLPRCHRHQRRLFGHHQLRDRPRRPRRRRPRPGRRADRAAGHDAQLPGRRQAHRARRHRRHRGDRRPTTTRRFVDLGTVDGKLYGLFYKQDLKSIVWYPVKAFADAGYAVPTTWDELVALSDKIVADGSNPWCTTIEHGDASGWVATDWLEDIVLRTAGADDYDQWVNHEIPFNDPAILAAAEHGGPDVVHRGLRLRRQHPDQRDLGRRLADPDVRRGRPEVLDAQAGRLDPRLLAEGCRRQRAVQAGRRQLVLLLPARSTQRTATRSWAAATCSSCSTIAPRSGRSSSGSRPSDAVKDRVATGALPRGQQRRPGRVVHELPDVRPGRDRPRRRPPSASTHRTRCRRRSETGRSGRGWSSGSRRTARAPRPSSRRSRPAGRRVTGTRPVLRVMGSVPDRPHHRYWSESGPP